MTKAISGIVILIIILGGIFLFRGKTAAPTADELGSTNATSTLEDSSGNSNIPTTSIKAFTVDGTNFSFAPSTLTVKKGDTVRITLVNKLGTHDFRLDEFNVATKVLKAGESETVEFVASKTGSYEYYCSIGNHRAMGMKGTLTVEE